MRLSKAIESIAQGSNFNHEVLVLLCEIADMMEGISGKLTVPEKSSILARTTGQTLIGGKSGNYLTIEPVETFVEPFIPEKIERKRGRPKKKLDLRSK